MGARNQTRVPRGMDTIWDHISIYTWDVTHGIHIYIYGILWDTLGYYIYICCIWEYYMLLYGMFFG